MQEAVLDRPRLARVIEGGLERSTQDRHVLVVDMASMQLAVELLGQVPGHRFDGPAVVDGDALLVEQRDGLVALVDQRAEARFPFGQAAAEPRPFARIAQRARRAAAASVLLLTR